MTETIRENARTARNTVGTALFGAFAALLVAGAMTGTAQADPNEDRAERCAVSDEICKAREFNAPKPDNGRDTRPTPRLGFDAPVMSGPFGSFN